MTNDGGCAACRGDTPKKAVSPYEEVSATFCDECRHVVALLDGFVDPAPPTAQAALQLINLRRLRRVEQVGHELIRRRIFSALLAKATWEEIAEALGVTVDEAKKRYPLSPNRDAGGWD